MINYKINIYYLIFKYSIFIFSFIFISFSLIIFKKFKYQLLCFFIKSIK